MISEAGNTGSTDADTWAVRGTAPDFIEMSENDDFFLHFFEKKSSYVKNRDKKSTQN